MMLYRCTCVFLQETSACYGNTLVRKILLRNLCPFLWLKLFPLKIFSEILQENKSYPSCLKQRHKDSRVFNATTTSFILGEIGKNSLSKMIAFDHISFSQVIISTAQTFCCCRRVNKLAQKNFIVAYSNAQQRMNSLNPETNSVSRGKQCPIPTQFLSSTRIGSTS